MTDDQKNDRKNPTSSKPDKAGSAVPEASGKGNQTFQVSSNGTVTPPPKTDDKRANMGTAKKAAEDSSANNKNGPSSTAGKSPKEGAKDQIKAKKTSLKPYVYGICAMALLTGSLVIYPVFERGAGAPALPYPLGSLAHSLNEQLFGVPPVVEAEMSLDEKLNPILDRLAALENSNSTAELVSLTDRIAAVEEAISLQQQMPEITSPVVDVPGNISDIEIQLTELTDRIQELEMTPSPPLQEGENAEVDGLPKEQAPAVTVDQKTMNDIIKRLEQAETALGVVQTEVSGALIDETTARQEELANVEARLSDKLGELEKAVDNSGTGTAAMALGLSNLRRTIDSGRPFQVELDAVRDELHAAGFGDSVAFLEKHAEQGVVTLFELRKQFPGVIRSMLETAAAGEEPGWQDKLRARLSTIVTIRKSGEVDGDDVEAVLARMEQHLIEHNAEAAFTESDSLPTSVKQAEAEWLADLALKVETDTTVKKLTADLIRKIDG